MLEKGNFHPLFSMDEKEIRKAEKLFEMLDQHLSKPLIVCKSDIEIFHIDSTYNEFVLISEQLSKKIHEIAKAVLKREFGIEIGMIIKIATIDSSDIAIIKIMSLYLTRSSPLSSSPHQWEWRVRGYNLAAGTKRSPSIIEYPLKGNLSIDRQILNGMWIPLAESQTKTMPKKSLQCA